MDYERNLAYFVKKYTLGYIGIGVTAFFLILYLILDNAIKGAANTVFTLVMLAGIIAGIVVMCKGFGGRSDEENLDIQVRYFTKDDVAAAQKKLHVGDYMLRLTKFTSFGGYDFNGPEEFYAKRGKDNKLRSTIYTSTQVLTFSERFYAYKKRMSLVDPDFESEEIYIKTYDQIEKAEMRDTDYAYLPPLSKPEDKPENIVLHNLVISFTDGSELVIPSEDNMDVDNVIKSVAQYKRSGSMNNGYENE